MRVLLYILLVVTAVGCRRAAPPRAEVSGYVDGKVCAGCHAEIARSYARSGMAQAFYRAAPERMRKEDWGKGKLYHAASERFYEFAERGGKYYLKRWQKGFGGAEENVLEAEIHYVMGSGNAARSYLTRTAEGRLAELPVAWYAEKGGYFAMSPGYDRADHQGFRRKISTDCMFCHNAYPQGREMAPASEPVWGEALPEGIDCQRCHGPGRAHVEAAGVAGAKPEVVKAAIVNPGRLERERSYEICQQCHLETTSFPLPNSLVRFGKGAFDFTPGGKLGEFQLHFDHAAGTGREGKFEIVSSVYRLGQSACFVKSGKMQCTTCHDPHKPAREDQARVEKACRGCHEAALRPHGEGKRCAECHMGQRRTEDVVHAAVTDHKITRRPEGKGLAPIAERHERPGQGYRGGVALYPARAAANVEEELYLALAQVVQRSNLKAGIAQLEALLAKAGEQPRFLFGLAQAYAADGQRERAVAAYRKVLEREPGFVPARRNLGELLQAMGKASEAIAVLEPAGENAAALHVLGQAYRDAGRVEDAVRVLRKAVALDGDFAEAHNSLGLVLMEKGDGAGALAALREAVRHQPDYAEARSNLGNALAVTGRLEEGLFQQERAVRMAPESVLAHFNYGVTLLGAQEVAAAEREFQAVVKRDPRHAEAREALGSVAASRGAWLVARREYEEALKVRPEFDRAQLGLGSALAALGETGKAREWLEKAARSGNGAIRGEAMEVLRMMGGK